MDPVTRAAQRFLAEAEAFFRAGKGPILPIFADIPERTSVMKALRLAELDPENRRPLFLYDVPFIEESTYSTALCQGIEQDYEQIRRGAEEEGVTLPPFAPKERTLSEDHSPLERAVLAIERVALLLGERFDGVFVAFIPERIDDALGFKNSVATLAATRFSARVRLALLSTPEGPLRDVLGEEGAHFYVDQEELFAYLSQLGTRGSAGPAEAPKPALPEESRRAYEEATGRRLPTAVAAERLRALLLQAANESRRGQHVVAAARFRDARALCQSESLALEEAMVLLALAGTCLAAGSAELAIDAYEKAAEIAEGVDENEVACQAWLGVGGAHMTDNHLELAVAAYRMSAAAAARAQMTVLQIEALRMAGTCALIQGSKQEAAINFQMAVNAGDSLDPATRRQSSFAEAATALIDVLRRLGLSQQARHVHSLLDQDRAQEAGSSGLHITAVSPPGSDLAQGSVVEPKIAASKPTSAVDTLPMAPLQTIEPALPFSADGKMARDPTVTAPPPPLRPTRVLPFTTAASSSDSPAPEQAVPKVDPSDRRQ